MKVVHIASSAFHYFDDIKAKVFSLAERQRLAGWDVEVLVLGYGATPKQENQAIERVAPGVAPAGFLGIDSVIGSLKNFDVIHLHGPVLGVGKVWRFIKKHPEIKLLVTYYQPTPLDDLFAYFIRLYNQYYLSKFFSRAELVFAWSGDDFVKTFGRVKVKVVDLAKAGQELIRQNIHLTPRDNQVKLTKEDGPYLACIEFTASIINS